MNLINARYLKTEILAFSGDEMNMWLIVYDGKYNYMLFDTLPNVILKRYKANQMPYNGIGSKKQIEFYSTFDCALDNLLRIIVNGNKWEPIFLNDIFFKILNHNNYYIVQESMLKKK